MRDQFVKTRYFLHKLSQATHDSISIAQNDIRKNDESFWLNILAKDNKILDTFDEQDKKCTREVWPVIIQELFDSVEYSRDLQQAYDSWMSLLIQDGPSTYTDKNITEYFESNAKCSLEIFDVCRRTLRRVRDKVSYLFWRIQEMKLEYDLHDKEYYCLYPIFSSLKESDGSAYEYVNGPEEDDEEEINMAIKLSKSVSQLFTTKEDYRNFFDDDNKLSCASWARKAWKFIQSNRLSLDLKGDKKTLYEEIKREHPNIAGLTTFTHTLNDLYKSSL